MTIHAVTMPKWGIEMTEGTLAQWSVREGQRVNKGDPLLEVETEKIVNTVESPAAATRIPGRAFMRPPPRRPQLLTTCVLWRKGPRQALMRVVRRKGWPPTCTSVRSRDASRKVSASTFQKCRVRAETAASRRKTLRRTPRALESHAGRALAHQAKTVQRIPGWCALTTPQCA